MLIYPNVKQAPIVGLSGFGGGTSSQVFTGAGATGGFGGYDFVGVITKDGATSVSGTGNVRTATQDPASSGSAFSYNGGSTLTGITGDGNRRYYRVTNPFDATTPWMGSPVRKSWTVVEKYYRASGSWGNANFGRMYNYNSNFTYFHLTRHDNRSGGCSGSWGTTYPYKAGADGYNGQNTSQPFCSVGYSGWWVNLASFDAFDDKYYWARSDSNMTDGAFIEVTGPSKDLSDWENYVGTSDNSYMDFYGDSNITYADWYIIYGKVCDTLSDAQEYNMLSRTHHIDPYNA